MGKNMCKNTSNYINVGNIKILLILTDVTRQLSNHVDYEEEVLICNWFQNVYTQQ